MKFKFSIMSAAIVTLMLGMPAAIGSSAQRVGQYDFSYLTSGALRATPVQVFDDGKNTYFQFRAGEAIPAIFQNSDGKVGLLVPNHEGPYVKVSEIGGRFTLQLGRSQASVVYAGNGRLDVPQITAVAASGMTAEYKGGGYPADPNVKLVASLAPAGAYLNADSLEANSYATPVKGDRVTWKDGETKSSEHKIWFAKGSQNVGPAAVKDISNIAHLLKNATRITIVGRDDESYKEGLEQARAQALRAAMIKLGVQGDRITVKTGVQQAPQKGLWASDIRVETVTPSLVARPSDTTALGSAERNAYVRANVDELVKARVITSEQAKVLLSRAGDHQQAPEPLRPAPPVAAKPIEVPAEGFDFKASDKSVAGTIRRWAAATNYQVLWDAPISSDAPITGDAFLQSSSMKDALEKVVAGLQKKGYDIQATVYSNRVIRFTGVTK